MAPNPLVAIQTLFRPDRWFKRSKSPEGKVEHWDAPEPGTYEYIPGRGWYFTIPDLRERLKQPIEVKYSRVLKRNLLRPDYDARKKYGPVTDAEGEVKEFGFFQLDDGIAWVKAWDEEGNFIPGPYERWIVDKHTGLFRKMVKGDDPEWQSRMSSQAASRNSTRPSSTRDRVDDSHRGSLSASRPSSRMDDSKRASLSSKPAPALGSSTGDLRSEQERKSTAVDPAKLSAQLKATAS